MSGPRPACGLECGAVEEEAMVINELLHLTTTGRLRRLAVIGVWLFLQLDPLTGYVLQGPFKAVPD